WYATTPKPATTTGTYMIVNRANSPFGAGWWLAGLERLSTGPMIWVGGDGSARQYTATGIPNLWTALSLDHPDTLKWDGSYFLRILPHGDTVKFNSQGQHV